MKNQTQLKARLLESIRSAESIDNLERLVRYLHHARGTERLNWSQYQDLLEAAAKARLRLASAGQKGGAA